MGAFTEHHTVHGGRKKSLSNAAKRGKGKASSPSSHIHFSLLPFFWTVDHQSVYNTSRLPHEPSDDVIITVILNKNKLNMKSPFDDS
jgi:hypothetical protein